LLRGCVTPAYSGQCVLSFHISHDLHWPTAHSTPASYWGGTGFKSRLEDRLSCVFMAFPQFLQAYFEKYFKLRHPRGQPYPFQFILIDLLTPYCSHYAQRL
jgi:hypothetical protein